MSRTSSAKRKPRTRGRPIATAEADVRVALLEAAQRLFLKHGFANVTARQLAAAAGTTPAMIHYYFENMAGLFRAMFQQAAEPFFKLLAEAADMPAVDVEQLMSTHMQVNAANPWIATLIVNEVLPEGGELRATFMRDIAAPMLPMLVKLLEHGRATGRFRADIEPRFTAISLMGLCVFPFISRFVAGQVLGIKLEGTELQQLIAHTTRLLLEGIANRASGESS